MKKKFALLIAAGALCISSCAGIRETDDSFAVHAESFRIFGIALPSDDQAAADAMVPDGATITSVAASPADWTSFFGVLGNLFGLHSTRIAGTK